MPKRFKVVQKSRSGQPAVDLTFTSWDLAPQIGDATFIPKVPADYEGIAVLQRAAAVRKTAAAAGFTRIGPDEVDERIETGPLRISSRFKSGVLE